MLDGSTGSRAERFFAATVPFAAGRYEETVTRFVLDWVEGDTQRELLVLR